MKTDVSFFEKKKFMHAIVVHSAHWHKHWALAVRHGVLYGSFDSENWIAYRETNLLITLVLYFFGFCSLLFNEIPSLSHRKTLVIARMCKKIYRKYALNGIGLYDIRKLTFFIFTSLVLFSTRHLIENRPSGTGIQAGKFPIKWTSFARILCNDCYEHEHEH